MAPAARFISQETAIMAEFRDVIRQLCHRDHSFNVRQLEVLMLCDEQRDNPDERGVQSLARAMQVNKPSVTRAADRLEEAGLVSRHRPPHDRRLCTITLTKQGAEFCSHLRSGFPEPKTARRKAA